MILLQIAEVHIDKMMQLVVKIWTSAIKNTESANFFYKKFADSK